MKPEELFRRVLEGHRANVRFADLCKLVQDFGFLLDRQRGSHRIYYHPTLKLRLVLNPRGTDAKVYQIDEFLSMLEAHQVQSPYGTRDA